jgi:serine/threonine protein kinase/formylglycine-generating enzyme required for sulfatase activity
MTDLSGQYFGRYHLTERLGEGGMATVYKAYDTRLERDVAVKVIRSSAFPPEILDQILVRFDREAKSLAKLSHPNIVKVYDYGEHDGSPYLVMEYLSGGTLKRFLGKPLPWHSAVDLIFPVARGVTYAHQRGILHRDIKPANILITEDGEPMLSDFGIAKLLEANQTTFLTGTSTVIGTPEYMAPEQWNGITSPKSDQYSLGIVLYEMVTGRKPYVADTPAGILLKQATEPLPSPRKFIVDLPEELELLLIKTLAKDPDHRYRDLSTFTDSLKNLFPSATVVHPRPDQLEKTREASSHKQVPARDEEALAKQELKVAAAAMVQGEAEHPAKEEEGRAVIQDVNSEPVAGQKTEDKTPVPDEPKKEESLEPAAAIPGNAAQDVSSPIRFTRKPGSRGLVYGIGAIVLLLMIGGTGLGVYFNSRTTAAAQTPTHQVAEVASTPEKTITSQAPTSNAPVSFASPVMSVGSSYPYIDGSILAAVPAGEFTMGGDGKDNPKHQVKLADYWISSTEVTNQQYALCVSQGKCEAPNPDDNPGYTDIKLANNPVTGVTYKQSADYCKFVNGRLPSEAEWEKAAQSPTGGSYPWGNAEPSCDLLNYNNCQAGTASVIQYEAGASQYGALSMAGNAFEWVADWYDANYYAGSPTENPTGPASGAQRSVRSSSYASKEDEIAVTVRNSEDPGKHRSDLGFRCVVDDPSHFAPFCQSPLIYGAISTQDAASLETCPVLEIKPVEVCNGSTPQFNVTFTGPFDAQIDAQGCTQFSTDPIRYACTSKGKIVSMTAACQWNDPGSRSCLPGYSVKDHVCVVNVENRAGTNCLAGSYDPTNQCCNIPAGQTDATSLITCPLGTFYSTKVSGCLPQSVREIVTVSQEVTLPACAAAKGGGGKGGGSTGGTGSGGNTGGCNASQAKIDNCNAQAPYYSWNSSTCSCEPSK